MRQALDLSNYDWPLTPEQVDEFRAAGVTEVIVGCQRVDPAIGIIRVCRSRGLTVKAVYAYLYWGYDVLEEVNKAISVAKLEGGITRIWLDCEQGGEAPGVDPAARIAQLRQAVIQVQHSGFAVGIYTGGPFWANCMNNTTEFARFPLWHAAYWDDRHIVERVDYGGWSRVAIHQYASSPELAGRNRDYDVILNDPDEEDEMEGYRLWLMQVGGGSYQDAKLAYATLDDAGFFAELNASDGPVDHTSDDVNAAIMRRFRIGNWLAASDKAQAAYQALGGK